MVLLTAGIGIVALGLQRHAERSGTHGHIGRGGCARTLHIGSGLLHIVYSLGAGLRSGKRHAVDNAQRDGSDAAASVHELHLPAIVQLALGIVARVGDAVDIGFGKHGEAAVGAVHVEGAVGSRLGLQTTLCGQGYKEGGEACLHSFTNLWVRPSVSNT